MKYWLNDHKRSLVVIGIIYIAIICLLTIKLPYEVYLPGGITPVDQVIEVEHEQNPSGEFYTSYVRVYTEPSIFQYLLAEKLNYTEIEELTGTYSKLTNEERTNYMSLEKEQSIYHSIILAYTEAEHSLTYNENGVIITYIGDGYEAFNQIKIGDIITAINGNKITNLKTFDTVSKNINFYDQVDLTILRNKESIQVSLEKVDRSMIGMIADESTNGGIIVSHVYEEFAAKNDLIRGDHIIAVNDQPISSLGDFKKYISDIPYKQDIQITLIRDGIEITVTTHKSYRDELSTYGLHGYTKYETMQGSPKFTISKKGYGGSGGLMQTLAVYNEITTKDITHGLKIAGTGTIGLDGTVGRIGGIEQKVVGAIKQEVDIFFAPNTLVVSNGGIYNLYERANQINNELDSDMIVVPVATIEEAIDYLHNYEGDGNYEKL
ncbi:PDZ domain-containing protein [Haloplasma contractile]|uniref:Degradative enzyme protein n=1 Tax=Haloplasma contractile SSD-17B TaxID=1033810 RepID=U2E077_9MOLU|nr:PDZ domain-containing protein [Haloplasma contractile]ERJ13832.1 degradative enzyme protein [Haloplasma contractile SSD-17B]